MICGLDFPLDSSLKCADVHSHGSYLLGGCTVHVDPRVGCEPGAGRWLSSLVRVEVCVKDWQLGYVYRD